MADIMMEYKGKRKPVPADKVEAVKRAGGVVVEDNSGEADKESDISMLESAAAGAAKFATGGLSDAAAGIGAGLGAMQESGNQGESVKEQLSKGLAGYREGAKERREDEEEAYQANPKSYIGGGALGALGTAPLTQGKTVESTALRSGLTGGASGYGMSEGDDVWDDLLNAYIGANLGGAFGVAAGPAAQGLKSLAKNPGAALRGGLDAARSVAGKIEEIGSTPIGQAARTALVGPTGGMSESLFQASRLANKVLKPKAGVPTSAPPAEVTPSAGMSPVPDLREAAAAADIPLPVDASRRAALDTELANVRAAMGFEPTPVPSGAPIDEASIANLPQHPRFGKSPGAPVAPSKTAPARGRVKQAPKSPVESAEEAMAQIDEGLSPAAAPPEPAPPPASPLEAAEQAIDDLDIVASSPASAGAKRTARQWAGAADVEKIAAIEAHAAESFERFGSLDLAFIASRTGIPTTELAKILPAVARRMAGAPKPAAPAAGVRGRQRASSQFDPEAAAKQVPAGQEKVPMTARQRAHRGFR